MRISTLSTALSKTLMIMALLLILTTIVGSYLITPAGMKCSENSTAVPNYHCRTLELKKAQQSLDKLFLDSGQLSDHEISQSLFTILNTSYVHLAKPYKTSLWDNWLQWLKSFSPNYSDKRRKAFLDSQDSILLWKRGGGFCHQAAWIYVSHLRSLGLKARLVRLPGHYLAEVFERNTGWRLVDIDFGISWHSSFEVLTSLATARDEIEAAFLNRGFNKKQAEKYAAIYTSGKDLVQYRDYVYTKSFYLDELDTKLYSWLIPIILLVAGLVIAKLSRS